jgi:uncharacterized protein
MKSCPIDNAQLMEINKSGVMVDVCPECKGIWLDRGELEKLVVVTKQLEAEFDSDPRDSRRIEGRMEARDSEREPDRYREDSRYDSRDERSRKRDRDFEDDDDDRSRRGKRGGALGRIFDIFD